TRSARVCATPPPPWRRLAAPPRLRRDTTRPRAPGAAAARSPTASRLSELPAERGRVKRPRPRWATNPRPHTERRDRCGTPALPTPRTSPQGQVPDDLVP